YLVCIPFSSFLIISMNKVYTDYTVIHQDILKRDAIIKKSHLNNNNRNIKIPKLNLQNTRYVYTYDITLNPDEFKNKTYANYYNLNSVELDNSSLEFVFSMELLKPQFDLYTVYYDTGNGFNEQESSSEFIYNYNKIYIGIPKTRNDIRRLRIDPGTKEATINIKSITLIKGSQEYTLSAKQIEEKLSTLNQINASIQDDNNLQLISSGNDPYFELIDVQEFLKK
ncbi:DUF6056 family protein, partial [Paenibacillus elgii]